MIIRDYYEVSYNLLNKSTMYGALVNIECGTNSDGTGSLNPFSYSGDIENIIINAQGNYEGKIKFTYSTESSTDTTLSFTCKVVAEALSTDVNGAIVEEEKKEMEPILLDYTGGEQTFTAPYTGTYKLETWGAQGGSYNSTYHGGYGGYSTGTIKLKKGDIIYINVGGSGSGGASTNSGGYNGGGYSAKDSIYSGYSGGGATHIATTSGILSSLSSNRESILIVSGGGGGAGYYHYYSTYYYSDGGNGGGYVGMAATIGYYSGYLENGGTQNSGGYNTYASSYYIECTYGAFGQGGSCDVLTATTGGGGGYYGGSGGPEGLEAGGGGSGYIGNTNLTNKVMYCYNCTESSEIDTKTISTTCVSETPIENCAKIGNGYVRITLVE